MRPGTAERARDVRETRTMVRSKQDLRRAGRGARAGETSRAYARAHTHRHTRISRANLRLSGSTQGRGAGVGVVVVGGAGGEELAGKQGSWGTIEGLRQQEWILSAFTGPIYGCRGQLSRAAGEHLKDSKQHGDSPAEAGRNRPSRRPESESPVSARVIPVLSGHNLNAAGPTAGSRPAAPGSPKY